VSKRQSKKLQKALKALRAVQKLERENLARQEKRYALSELISQKQDEIQSKDLALDTLYTALDRDEQEIFDKIDIALLVKLHIPLKL